MSVCCEASRSPAADNTTSYVLIAVGLYLLVKYQQAVRRFLRRLLSDNPTPADALTSDFTGASEDADSLAEETAATSSLLAPSEAVRLLRGGGDSATGPISEQSDGATSPGRTHRAESGFDDDDDEEGSSAEVEAAFRAAYATSAASAGGGSAAATPSRGSALQPLPTLQPPSMAFLAQFLKMMRHTVQGISTRAVLALYARLERVSLRRGEVLFRAGG